MILITQVTVAGHANEKEKFQEKLLGLLESADADTGDSFLKIVIKVSLRNV